MLTPSGESNKPQKSANQGHIAYSIGHRVPKTIRRPRNPIRTAVDALFPWRGHPSDPTDKPLYRGPRASLIALTCGRVGIEAVRQWLKGKRAAPNWFVAVLLDQLRQRRAEIDLAIQALEVMPERRGMGAGLRDWHRAKKARENEAQTARERQEDKNRILRGRS